MKVVLYARVSTDKCEIPGCGKKPAAHPKAGHDFRGQDPEVQLCELREWCQREGYIIAFEYVDYGFTGKNTDRPELLRLLRDAEKGLRDFEAVIVWRLDRFGRSVHDLTVNMKRLKAAKINFISKQEKFDLNTSTGRLHFGFLCLIAEYFLDVLSENTKAGMRRAREKGHYPGPKIDQERGACRMTRYRQRKRAELASLHM